MQNINDEFYIGAYKFTGKPVIFHKNCPTWTRRDNSDGIAIYEIWGKYNQHFVSGGCNCKKEVPKNLITQLLLIREEA